MKGVMRYLAALLAVVLLLGAALLAMTGVLTTETFLRQALGGEVLLALQQAKVDAAVETLTQTWQVSPAVLTEVSQGAAERYTDVLAEWWGELWRDPEADPYLPMYLDAAQERTLVSAIMADAGFVSATEADQRRAIARDEVAYALDEAVCDAVLPVRRSLVELGLSLASEQVRLPMLRNAALIAAAMAAGAGVLLLLAAHRAAGSALTATALSMAATGAMVMLADVPGMLVRLNPLAAEQAKQILLCAGVCWYGAALALALTGLVILGIKRIIRGRRDDAEVDQTIQ